MDEAGEGSDEPDGTLEQPRAPPGRGVGLGRRLGSRAPRFGVRRREKDRHVRESTNRGRGCQFENDVAIPGPRLLGLTAAALAPILGVRVRGRTSFQQGSASLGIG